MVPFKLQFHCVRITRSLKSTRAAGESHIQVEAVPNGGSRETLQRRQASCQRTQVARRPGGRVTVAVQVAHAQRRHRVPAYSSARRSVRKKYQPIDRPSRAQFLHCVRASDRNSISAISTTEQATTCAFVRDSFQYQNQRP